MAASLNIPSKYRQGVAVAELGCSQIGGQSIAVFHAAPNIEKYVFSDLRVRYREPLAALSHNSAGRNNIAATQEFYGFRWIPFPIGIKMGSLNCPFHFAGWKPPNVANFYVSDITTFVRKSMNTSYPGTQVSALGGFGKGILIGSDSREQFSGTPEGTSKASNGDGGQKDESLIILMEKNAYAFLYPGREGEVADTFLKDLLVFILVWVGCAITKRRRVGEDPNNGSQDQNDGSPRTFQHRAIAVPKISGFWRLL